MAGICARSLRNASTSERQIPNCVTGSAGTAWIERVGSVLTRFPARFQAKWIPVSRPESAPILRSGRAFGRKTGSPLLLNARLNRKATSPENAMPLTTIRGHMIWYHIKIEKGEPDGRGSGLQAWRHGGGRSA